MRNKIGLFNGNMPRGWNARQSPEGYNDEGDASYNIKYNGKGARYP
jgi:hypothetical protein